VRMSQPSQGLLDTDRRGKAQERTGSQCSGDGDQDDQPVGRPQIPLALGRHGKGRSQARRPYSWLVEQLQGWEAPLMRLGRLSARPSSLAVTARVAALLFLGALAIMSAIAGWSNVTARLDLHLSL
jgi:hypothetical protein